MSFPLTNPQTFLYAAEISPLSVRVPITSISTGSAWIFNFLVAQITPVGLSTLGSRYYIIYTCINFFLIFPCKHPSFIKTNLNLYRLVAVYFFFPETAGRHLEQVDQIFRESRNILDPVKVARKLPKDTPLDISVPDEKIAIEQEEAKSQGD